MATTTRAGPRAVTLTEERMTFQQTMRFAESNGLASNREVNSLVITGELGGAFRTGTICVAEAPNKKFGAAVEFSGITVPIPKEFQGMKNKLLVSEHPFYTFQNGVLTLQNIQVQGYPKTNGWYLPNEATMIPEGRKVSRSNSRALYLYRTNRPYAGSVVRVVNGFMRYVDLDYVAGNDLRVAQIGTEGNGVAVSQSGLTINGVTAVQFETAKAAFQKAAPTLHPEIAEPLAVLFRGEAQ